MSELYYQDKENRPGNSYPVITDNRMTPDRESMLYSYANTVEECYAGDFRIYAKKFGDYLRDSKSKVFDLSKQEFIDIPIRYASPQQAFSDNIPTNSTGVATEASLTNRVVLPLISYYILDSKRDEKRAVNPCVRYRVKPKNKNFDKAFTTHAPIPIDYQIQVDIWTEFREHLFQLLTAFHNDFNPLSYLTDVYDMADETNKLFYTPYVPMILDSISDNSNFIPGTDRRVVRGTIRITIKGWMTPPLHEASYVHKTITEFGVGHDIELAKSANSPQGGGFYCPAIDYEFTFDPKPPTPLQNIIRESAITPELALRFDYISETLGYKGEALVGTEDDEHSWRISRIEVTNEFDVSITWANGTNGFVHSWNDRLSLVYS